MTTTKKRRRRARPLNDVSDPWRFVVFTDLHVSATTLDRAVAVLRRVRGLAKEYDAKVVCLGDFWHQRGHLSVRQLDVLLAEFQQWTDIDFMLIPGNHDQVTEDGLVHGVRVFDAFPNITVATEPVFWKDSKVAFLPWREEPGAQAKLFELEDDGPWTVFAHAEVKGATTNGAYLAPGRVTAQQIEKVARACYCGHYHRRQRLGDRTWYIGSPFEMNFGERDMPHGVAIVSSDRVEPHFINFEDFPKHHRLTYGGVWPNQIASHDIVEIHAPADVIGSDRLRQVIQELAADDVRTVVLAQTEDDEAPKIAMGLEEAMHEWVQSADEGDMDRYRLRQLGQTILSEVPEARPIAAISTDVDIQSVEVTGFCGIRDTQFFEFPDGVCLIKGPMGSGKTSMMDALTWAFFGTTTPRKAGSHGAALRADEVIHDELTACSVKVSLRLKGRSKPVTVLRRKKRGSGSKVKVGGIRMPDGISDQQDLVRAVLGIDHALWRTCVYLGQGAVGNFVTDADKRRKELLSTAFGLDVCPVAQNYARDRRNDAESRLADLLHVMAVDERAIEIHQNEDFKEQITQWEGRRQGVLEAAQSSGEQAKEAIATCEKHLEAEPQWLESQQAHRLHVDKLTKSLVGQTPEDQVADIQRQMGAAEAEKLIASRDWSLAKQQLTEAVNTKVSVCPVCNQPVDEATHEHQIVELENKVQSGEANMRTFDSKFANLTVQLQAAQNSESAQRTGIEIEIGQSREALEKCGEALNTLTVIKSNKAEAERRLADARISYIQHEKEVNPFLTKQNENEAKVGSLRTKQAADCVERDALTEKVEDFEFWVQGFGPKGLPVIVLRAALHELESYANVFLNKLLRGRVYIQLVMAGEDLKIAFFEADPATGKVHERRYEQLSGGQRRCVELAFNPLALGEMVFSRSGVRVQNLIADEITTHLDPETKPVVCEILRDLDRRSVVVIDHDLVVQSEFDQVFDLTAPLALEAAS